MIYKNPNCKIISSYALSVLGGLLFPLVATSAQQPTAIFTDISASAGLDFVHFNGMVGAFHFPEMTGQGGALFDFDNDGDLDVYLVQGAPLANPAAPSKKQWRDRLYRNDLHTDAHGIRQVHLVDVTQASGIRMTGYGMGVATGDVNNDGWIDLYITNFGTNHLLINQGNGRFLEASLPNVPAAWSSSASFLDFDRDGWLDLYVANYVDYSLTKNPVCYALSSQRDYCGPSGFAPAQDHLYRNQGEKGGFKEVSALLLGYRPGPSLGVVSADFNDDGWVDLYVANDGTPNQLWLNQAGKSFKEEALFSGVAVNRHGASEASMGVTAGDFDADGDEDLFLTHLLGESNTLYQNEGAGYFTDRTIETGLAAASIPYTSFGTHWLDFDNDGWLDLFIANGAVQIQESLARKGDRYPLDQNNQLFQNQAGKSFKEVSAEAGNAFQTAQVSRGAAFGDLDNDGDTDVLVFNNNGPARLLRNNKGQQQAWLGLRVVAATGGYDSVGARVAVHRKGASTLWRRVHSDGSYCSANDLRLLVGLGNAATVTSVDIYWPDGSKETWQHPVLGRYSTLAKGFSRSK